MYTNTTQQTSSNNLNEGDESQSIPPQIKTEDFTSANENSSTTPNDQQQLLSYYGFTIPEGMNGTYGYASSSPTNQSSAGSPLGDEPQFELREQDRFLPIANIHKIMKKALPPNNKIKISKEAKETMQECVSEFISFITSESSDHCVNEKRKTITGDDLLVAMQTLGFDNYVEPLRNYLYRYREHMNQDKGAKRKRGDQQNQF